MKKVSIGGLNLGGVNLYTGPTTISRGRLALVGGGSIADFSEVDLANAGVTFAIGNTTAGASIRTLRGVGGSTVDLGRADADRYPASSGFSGVILGTGGLTVAGGTETLGGVNTYTGQTAIAGGTLVLSGAGSIAGLSDVGLSGADAKFDISHSNSGASITTLDGVAGSAVELGTQSLTVANGSPASAFAGRSMARAA